MTRSLTIGLALAVGVAVGFGYVNTNAHGLRLDGSAQSSAQSEARRDFAENGLTGMQCQHVLAILKEPSTAQTFDAILLSWMDGFIRGVALTLYAGFEEPVATATLATLQESDDRLAVVMATAANTTITGALPLVKRASGATRRSQLLDACQDHPNDPMAKVAHGLIMTWFDVPHERTPR